MINQVNNWLVLICKERNIPFFFYGRNVAISPISGDDSHDRETPNRQSRKSTKIKYPSKILQNPKL